MRQLDMARPKVLSDEIVLSHALDLMRRTGPDRLTFASLSAATGLSGATLVQRFRSKAELRQRALLHAWDMLEERTAQLVAVMEKTPEGARRLLVDLSRDYGGTDAYAEGLMLLREDMLDPVLRTRGAEWRKTLNHALDACFAIRVGVPDGVGSMIATYWQGALLWWAFDPSIPVHVYVDDALWRFVSAISHSK
jgi:AcrR family transcriptional regulator